VRPKIVKLPLECLHCNCAILCIAGVRCCWCESGASAKCVLGGRRATEAARLAPTCQARNLAILETILCSGIIAFSARRADRKRAHRARSEFVEPSSSQTNLGCLLQCCLRCAEFTKLFLPQWLGRDVFLLFCFGHQAAVAEFSRIMIIGLHLQCDYS